MAPEQRRDYDLVRSYFLGSPAALFRRPAPTATVRVEIWSITGRVFCVDNRWRRRVAALRFSAHPADRRGWEDRSRALDPLALPWAGPGRDLLRWWLRWSDNDRRPGTGPQLRLLRLHAALSGRPADGRRARSLLGAARIATCPESGHPWGSAPVAEPIPPTTLGNLGRFLSTLAPPG